MAFLITKNKKKFSKYYQNTLHEFVIPKNKIMELAYKIDNDKDEKGQVVGAYINFKIGDEVFPSIVEFSREEVEIIGEVVRKNELFLKAVNSGTLFFVNQEICTCREFVRFVNLLPAKEYVTVNSNEHILRVSTRDSCSYKGKVILTIVLEPK